MVAQLAHNQQDTGSVPVGSTKIMTMEDEDEYSWANVERPARDKEEVVEEPKTCNLDDKECLSCGS